MRFAAGDRHGVGATRRRGPIEYLLADTPRGCGVIDAIADGESRTTNWRRSRAGDCKKPPGGKHGR